MSPHLGRIEGGAVLPATAGAALVSRTVGAGHPRAGSPAAGAAVP